MRRACNFFRTALAVFSLVSAASFAAAQNSGHSGPDVGQQSVQATFKSQANVVEVPAVVTDSDGKHIHGLSKSDFRVFENGKEQKVAFLEEVTTSKSPFPATNNPADGFTNLSVNTAGRHAVTVVLLDELNTPYLDQVYGRRQLVKYLAENLDSEQTISLMLLGRKGVTRVSNFTDDPSSVINAVKKINSELPAWQAYSAGAPGLQNIPAGVATPFHPSQNETERILREFFVEGVGSDESFGRPRAVEDTMQAFLSIAWSLSGVPGRKSLIWATGSFPFYLDSPSAIPGDSHLSALYERTMESLNDAQISVYPVDVRGLVGNAWASEASDTNWARKPARGGPALAATSTAEGDVQLSTIANMETFASMTGGRAFVNRNDLATGFLRAAQDSSSYYLLGYYLNPQNTKPGWRKLRVRVEGHHAEVRAREGFFVGTTHMSADAAHQADVNFALTSPFESTGIPMLVRWNPATSQTKDGKKSEFAVVVPAGSVVQEADQNQFDYEVIWEADRDGAPAQRDGKTMKGSADAQSLVRIKREGVVFKNFVQLPAGEYKVHFVVRNNLNGRIGSVTAPLTVN